MILRFRLLSALFCAGLMFLYFRIDAQASADHAEQSLSLQAFLWYTESHLRARIRPIFQSEQIGGRARLS